jgi:hypothetical protein
MEINELIKNRIIQITSRQVTCNIKAKSTNCTTQRIKMKSEAAKCQVILDEYKILETQIKQNT